MRGTIKFFDDVRGFGFVTPDDGSGDVFIHATSAHGVDLVDGLQIEFDVGPGYGAHAHKKQAVNITIPAPAPVKFGA